MNTTTCNTPRKRSALHLLPVETASLAYIILTAIYITVFNRKMEAPLTHLAIRGGVAAIILILARQRKWSAHPVIKFVRCFLPFALLSFWYPETYYLNSFLMDNMDHHFVKADQLLFGCQPSIEFSQRMPWAWFSELMYFGYFSYYFIIFGTALWCYVCRRQLFNRATFLIICSFFLYYITYSILPVIGPQFYFAAPLNEVPNGYIFSTIMRFLQATGEKPTGAFPSSHIALTFTAIIFIAQHCRILLKYAVPLFVILILSTVYIKAHYLIDVLGGFAAVALTYPLISYLYRKIAPCDRIVAS